METLNESQANLKKVICPIVTVWILFFMNLMFFLDYDLFYIYFNRITGLFLIFYLFIILCLFIIAILITISIERNKYRLYFIGFIMSIIFEAIVTIGLFIIFLNKSKYFVFYLILLLIEWTLFIVLISYKKTVWQNSQNNEVNQRLVNMSQGEGCSIQI